MAELAVGNFVKFTSGPDTRFCFQNFFIGESITYDSNSYAFVPFGFSGITINATGDGVDCSLAFPNSTENIGALTRTFSKDAVAERWIAYVRVLIVDPDDQTSFTQLCQYYGQISMGGWDESTVSLTLNSVLDAIGMDVPQRRLSQDLVGDIPSTSNVRLQ